MSKLRKKCVELIPYELAAEDIGIYPQSINGKQRTEWQEGWNACAMENAKNVSAITSFLKTLPEQVVDYIIDGNIRVIIRDELCSMVVDCNDLFYWACADDEAFDAANDLEDFNLAYKDSPKNGGILWCCRKRGMRPQNPYYKYFNQEEAKLFDACGPERDV